MGAYGGLGYHGLGYAGYPYAVAKPVVNEVEVPVPVVQYAAIDTGCKNSFGHAVPCPTDSALATMVLATPDLDTMDSDMLDSATPMPWLPPPLSRLRSPSPSTSTCLR